MPENLEAIETDNSQEVENTEPTEEIVDNSQENETQTEPVENDDEVQGQFKTLEDATKSYSELQKKLGQQSNELGELRKIKEVYEKEQAEKQQKELEKAQSKGFETVQAYQNNKDLSSNLVALYSKHLNKVDFPAEVATLLQQYDENPTPELLETIEAEFPLSVVKEVTLSNEMFKGQLQEKENEALAQQITQSARDYLNANVKKYKEEFQNPQFARLYGEAFKLGGCNLDTDLFVSLMKEYKDALISEHGVKNGINDENKTATDEIAGLTSGEQASNGGSKSLLDMAPDELKAYIRKNI